MSLLHPAAKIVAGTLRTRPQSFAWRSAAMEKRDKVVSELCKELGVCLSTIYKHVTAEGELTDAGRSLLKT